MKAQQTLTVMAGRDKATGERVWAVQSASQTAALGYPVFHILRWDEQHARWLCPCPAYKPCIHMKMASDASKAERDANLIAGIEAEYSWQKYSSVDELMEVVERKAAQSEPIMQRNDTGPRLYRTAQPLPERVREVM